MCVQQPRGQLLLRPIPDPKPPTRLLDPSPRPCEKGYEIWVGGGVPGLGGQFGWGIEPALGKPTRIDQFRLGQPVFGRNRTQIGDVRRGLGGRSNPSWSQAEWNSARAKIR